VIHGRADEDVDHVGTSVGDLALCSDFQTTVKFSLLSLPLYNCLHTKAIPEWHIDLLHHIDVPALYLRSLIYPTPRNTVVDNRVYGITVYIYILRLLFTALSVLECCRSPMEVTWSCHP